MAVDPSNQLPPQSMGSVNTVFVTQLRFDSSYIKTTPGILKLAVITLNVLAFVCVQSSPFRGAARGVLSSVVAQAGLWAGAALLAAYLLHAVEAYHRLRWLQLELALDVLLVFLNLAAATSAVAFGSPGYSAAGFFSYLAMVAYGGDAFLKINALQSGAPAQGSRVPAKPAPAAPA